MDRRLATARRAELVFVGSCSLRFVTLGVIVLPYPGIENDEALFAAPLYQPYIWYAKIAIFHHSFPTMLTSYLGTLKTCIYSLLFRIWAPSVLSIRLPVILMGAATIWLSFLLMCRLHRRRSALAAPVFLATDVTFLCTMCFDWGPVALQHLLLVSGVLMLVKGMKMILSEISDPDHVFVGHTVELEVFKGVGEHLSRWARDSGYEEVHLETVCDGNGRPVFEIFRFRETDRGRRRGSRRGSI